MFPQGLNEKFFLIHFYDFIFIVILFTVLLAKIDLELLEL